MIDGIGISIVLDLRPWVIAGSIVITMSSTPTPTPTPTPTANPSVHVATLVPSSKPEPGPESEALPVLHPGPCIAAYDVRFPDHIGADGIPDVMVKRTYDAMGRLVAEDWLPPDSRTRRLEYDAEGRLSREVVRQSDPTLVWSATHRYDRAGRLVEKTLDENADGKPDWLELRRYDGEGRLVELHENVNPRTRRGGLGHWTIYDGAGRAVVGKIDNDDDGKPDRETRFTHDAAGRLVHEYSFWYDEPGHISESFTYTYDAAGRLLTKTDRHGTTSVHTYDEAGNLLRKEEQQPRMAADGFPLVRVTYDYGCWTR